MQDVSGEKFYCNSCANKLFIGKSEVGYSKDENTSGRGQMSVISPEIKGWNWGALILGWIWGIGNGVWI